MPDAKNKNEARGNVKELDNVIELNFENKSQEAATENNTETSEGTTKVSLPVYSTKVLAGLETDETLAKVKRAQQKKPGTSNPRKPVK